MPFESLFLAIEESAVGAAMRESSTLFPMIESVHVLALTFVVGSIAAIDLRLLGLSARDQRVTTLSAELLPWTWGSFAVAAASGVLLFTSAATTYAANWAFQAKVLLILAAAVNMMVFHFVTWKKVHAWDAAPATPPAARLAGGLSLLFWILVVGFGRWIGFI